MYIILFLLMVASTVVNASYNDMDIDNTHIIVKNNTVDYIDGKCYVDGFLVVCNRCDSVANMVYCNDDKIVAYCNDCLHKLPKEDEPIVTDPS